MLDNRSLDSIQLNFNPDNVWIVNTIIAVIMFGVALDLKGDDFKRILRNPKAPLLGLAAQFLLFPAFTYLLTLLLRPHPSIALGMILVAACPGGNMSNFITYLSKGNTALSVSMTAVSTFIAIAMTPLNTTFWGRMNPDTAPLLHRIALDPVEMLLAVLYIIGIPLLAGLVVARRFPSVADRLHRPFKISSVCALLFIIAAVFKDNLSIFMDHVGLILLAVLPHSALAFAVGYCTTRLARLDSPDVRAVTIEVGIQNSALGLTLIFGFFPGLGGMTLVAGFWGVWHIIAGLSLAWWWSRTPLPQLAEEGAA